MGDPSVHLSVVQSFYPDRRASHNRRTRGYSPSQGQTRWGKTTTSAVRKTEPQGPEEPKPPRRRSGHLAGTGVSVPRQNLFKTQPRKGSPTNTKAQDRAQAQKENTAFRRRHCPVFSNEKGGGARSRRLRVTTLPPAAHRNSVVRGPVRHRSVQEVSKETQAGEEKRADPEAQRSTATTRVVPPRSPGHGPSSRCPRNPCNTGREGTPLGGCACVAVLRPDWPVLILRAGAP